jgi:hypothetical protein
MSAAREAQPGGGPKGVTRRESQEADSTWFGQPRGPRSPTMGGALK